MDTPIVFCLLLAATALAAPQGGYLPPSQNAQQCPTGQGLNALGQCAHLEITRNIFVYGPPPPSPTDGQATAGTPVVPRPKVDYNIVFVRTPERNGPGSEPIIVPPPQQKTLVYVLNRRNQQRVIQVPAGPNQNPEVFFVNYNEGQNPALPGGLNLNSVLGNQGQAGGFRQNAGNGAQGQGLNAGAGGFGNQAGFGNAGSQGGFGNTGNQGGFGNAVNQGSFGNSGAQGGSGNAVAGGLFLGAGHGNLGGASQSGATGFRGPQGAVVQVGPSFNANNNLDPSLIL